MTSYRVRTVLLSFVLLLACLVTCLFVTVNPITAYASNITINGGYSDVMEDLQSDADFDADSFKIDKTDYSLKVIQIAESSEKELFVYVYQPCSPNDDLRATTINISTTIGDDLSYKNYTLKLINFRGVFYKYVVENFVVSDEDTRYYDISSIFRKWNEKYDKKAENDNVINEVSFGVAMRYTAKTMEDGTVEYASNGVDVVYITDKWCGFCRYSGGFELLGWADACDSWFVAFNTDRDIDKLLEADVYYVEQKWTHGLMAYFAGMVGTSPVYTNDYVDYLMPEEINEENINDYSKIAELDYTQKGSFQGSGWWASKYTWDRIQTVDDFIKTENRENIFELGLINVKQETKLTNESLETLKGKKWVLRFVETAFEEEGTTEAHWYNQSIISNVSILRLKFETDGVVYNLGVVDNKQTGDTLPDNYTKTTFELSNAFKTFLAILLFILLLIILWPVLPYIFKFIGWLIKGIWKIICLPFTAIKSISKKREDKQNAKSQPTVKQVNKNNAKKKRKKQKSIC